MKKRYIFAIALGITLPTLYVGGYFSVRPRSMRQIEADKTINVATEYSALDYMVNNGDTSGFQYELLKTFADSLGCQLNITIEPNLIKNVEGLNSGKYDVVMRLLPITTNLREEVNFSEQILRNYMVLVQLSDKKYRPVRNVYDLNERVIYLPEGSPDELIINHINEELGIDIDIVHIPDIDAEHLLAMVANGEIAYAVTDLFTARSVKKYYPNLDCETQIGFTQQRAWAFPEKNADLCNLFNEWFANYKKSKEFGALYRKYYN